MPSQAAQYQQQPIRAMPHAPQQHQPPPQQQQQHMPPPPPSSATSHAPMSEAHRREAAHRMARKPTDKKIPDGIEKLAMPEQVKLYEQLRTAERRMDAFIVRKRLELSDPAIRQAGSANTHTFRIWISNTASNQHWQAAEQAAAGDGGADVFGLSEGSFPSFKVRVEGRLIDNNEAGDEGATARESTQADRQGTRFSDLFKKISIEFHQSGGGQPPPLDTIHWPPAQLSVQYPQGVPTAARQPAGGFDYLEFTRGADRNVNVTISLTPNDLLKERFMLSPQLSRLLDCAVDDRPGVLMSLWQYFKSRGIDPDGSSQNDELLRHLFGGQDPDPMQQHLFPLPPIRLKYTVRLDRDYISSSGSKYTVYDVPVSLYTNPTNPSAPGPASALAGSAPAARPKKHPLVVLQTVLHLDDALAAIVQSLADSKAKWNFLDGFARDPVRFVQRFVSSQRRDLAVLLCEGATGAAGAAAGPDLAASFLRPDGKSPSPAVWWSDEAHEAVTLWASSKRRGP